MPLQDVTDKIPGRLRANLISNEIAYHFAHADLKGGCRIGRAARSYVLISNKRVIYDASVKRGEEYTQSSGAIPMDKVSFVGVSSTETKGCNKRKTYLLTISSGGGTIELAMPTEAEARRLQKVISEVQASQSSLP